MSGVAGTIVFTGSIFERWAQYENLLQDLKDCCAILGLRSGLDFHVSENQLAAAHTAWQQEMDLWLSHLLPSGTTELSHLKRSSILLAKLCEFGCIKVSQPQGFLPGRRRRRNDPRAMELLPSPTPLPEKDVRKFKDGGGHYVGWLLAYHLCESFEPLREDKEPYVSRITEEFEIDMVSGLLSAKLSAQSIHLILKALFLRD